MAKQKLERNKLFLQDWQKGFGNEALGEKYKMTEGGVKALKQRLRVRNPNLYIKPPANKLASQQTSKQEKKTTSKELYKTVTYYITKEQKQKVKFAALQQEKEISQLVREILSEYFDRQ